VRALVTGGAGFIGTRMTAALHEAGYSVTGVDVADRYSPLDCREFFRQDTARYDLVVHCAAVVGGRRKIAWTPLEHAANLEIDAALFAWAQRTRPGRVVYFSSSCAYPVDLARAPVPGHLHEDDIRWPPWVGMWPDELYGWTKLTGELLARTAQSAGVPVSVVRPFSVYGDPAQMNDGFAVRGFMEQVQRKADPVVIWGDDRQTRDFIHVDDVCAATAAMAWQGIGGPVNLGTGRGTSLRELATMMGRAAGYEPGIKVDGSMPAGVMRLVADASRLREFYEPAVVLEDWLAQVLG
jgi:UDP-glucose 4-epimerase